MAGPLLNNVIQQNNLDQPISSLVSDEEQPESLFVQLTSSLSLTEMLALMQGNLGAISGMSKKLKTVLLKKIELDTAEKRKALAQGEADKFKSFLFVPSEVQPNVHEGFDPILVSEDVVDTHLTRILDVILDFDDTQSDAIFIEEMKDALAYFIGEWIEELQDGFMNGMQDVVVFFRENFKILIAQGAGPEMGMMVSAMGTDTLMQYVTKAYARYREKKTQIHAAAKAKAQQKKNGESQTPVAHEDVKMEDDQEEEQKNETPEQKRQRFLSKWDKVIAEDVEVMSSQPLIQQRPLSRAYLSLCPSNRSSNKQVQDEKNSANDYFASAQKENFQEIHVKQAIIANLMKAGFPQQKVDEVMGNVEHLPESLVQSYYDMLREDLTQRVQNDQDYQEKKSQGGATHYEHLDKL